MAGAACIVLASSRRTASLVAAAVPTAAARMSVSVSLCCATRCARMRRCHGGRSAGWRKGCMAESAMISAVLTTARAAMLSRRAVSSSVFQPREPGFLGGEGARGEEGELRES